MSINFKEQPYIILYSEENFEIRHYQNLLLVKASVPGPYELARKNGKKVIHDYLDGNNFKQARIKLDSPFILKSHSTGWETAYILPETLSCHSVPRPVDQSIQFEEQIAKKVAVSTFWGKDDYSHLVRRSDDLKNWTTKTRLKICHPSRIYLYREFWSMPFARKKEIHFDLN